MDGPRLRYLEAQDSPAPSCGSPPWRKACIAAGRGNIETKPRPIDLCPLS